MKLIKKKSVEEIDRPNIREFQLTLDQKRRFMRGIELFNERKFWEAHEAWEQVWRGREEDSRIFLQGIIQAAAAFHRVIERPSYLGALNHLEKAVKKLQLFPVRFLGINVEKLLQGIQNCLVEVQRLGTRKLDQFSIQLVPRIDVD